MKSLNTRPSTQVGGRRKIDDALSLSNAHHRRYIQDQEGKFELVYGKSKLLPDFAPKAGAQFQHGNRFKHGRIHQRNIVAKQNQVSIRGEYYNYVHPQSLYQKLGATTNNNLKKQRDSIVSKPPLPQRGPIITTEIEF